MIIGVPRETKDHETRVGLVPNGVTVLREAGHCVLVQASAGHASWISDSEYSEAGAEILHDPAQVWGRADLVVKVKEPQPAGREHVPRARDLCGGRRIARAAV
jgi:alanine dehydrogenase